jgi:hypothetical protein
MFFPIPIRQKNFLRKFSKFQIHFSISDLHLFTLPDRHRIMRAEMAHGTEMIYATFSVRWTIPLVYNVH